MRWPLPWPKSLRGDTPPEPGSGRSDAVPEAEAPPGLAEEEPPKSLRQQVLLFARDLAVAFLIVAIVMGLLTAYARVWPPMVVVESESMQHSDSESFVGVIDTGDLVIVQAVGTAVDVVSYVEGRATGHATYGDFGDVIVFIKPRTPLTSTPIIHRAMAYAVRNASGGADVPGLARLPATEWSARSTNGSTGNYAYGIWDFTLYNVGYQARNPTFNASAELALATVDAGFLTKGDHNQNPDSHGAVAVNRILGKARGELPWFGLLKLTLFPGRTGCCPDGWGDARAPKNSWDALLVSFVVIVVGPFALDFGWGWWKARSAEGARSRHPSRVFPRSLTTGLRIAYGGLGIGAAVGGVLQAFSVLDPGSLGPVHLGFSLLLLLGAAYLLSGAIKGGYGPRAEARGETAPGPPVAPAPEAAVTGEVRTESSGPEGGGPGPP